VNRVPQSPARALRSSAPKGIPAERRLLTQYAVTRALAECDSLADAAPRIIQAVCKTLDWQVGAIWTIDEALDQLVCEEVWRSGRVGSNFEALSREVAFSKGIGLPGRVWESRRPIWVPNVALDDNFPRGPVAAEEDLHGACAFPINLAGETTGVLEFFSRDIREPDEDVLGMLENLGSQVGQFMQRKRIELELAQHANQSQSIYLLADAVSHGLDIEQVYRIALDAIQLSLKVDRASLLVRDSDGVLRFKAWRGLADDYRAAVEGHSPWAPDDADPKPVLVSDIEDAPGYEELLPIIRKEGIRALAFVPLVNQGTLLGKFMLYYNAIHAFSPAEVQLAQTIASHIAFAMARKRADDALRNAEEQYRSIFEHAVFGAFQTTPDGKFLRANDALAQLLGYSSSRELVESVTDIGQQIHVSPERRAELARKLEEQGELRNFEAQAYRRDGSVIWLSFSARAIRDAGENVVRYEGIVEDITGRKQTDVELREVGNRLNATYNMAAVGISEIDMNGRFLAVNDRFCEITGYGREELLERRFQDITHPDDVKHDADLFESLKAGEIETYRLEKRYVHKNGSPIWIELNVSMVRDESGKPAYRIGVVQDITARKRAEEDAEAAQRRLSFLAEASAIVTSSLEYEKTLDNLARLVVGRLGDLCSIDMVDDGLVRRVALAHVDPEKEKLFAGMEKTYKPARESSHPVLRVTTSRRSELVNGITEETLKASARNAKHLKVLRALGVRCAMVVPLIAGARCLGAMTIVSTESGRRYEQVDLALAEELARRAALAIENASLYEAEQNARAAAEGAQQRLWFLAEANAVLSSSLDLETTLSRVAGLAVPWLADCCAVHIFPADGLEPRSAISHIDPAKEELVRQLHDQYAPAPGESHPIIQMMDTKASVLIKDIGDKEIASLVRDEAHREILRRLDFKSYMVVPLVARGRLFGAMTFATSAGKRPYTEDDLSLAEELARRAALALDNSRLYDEAQRIQDALRVALEAKDEFLGVMSHELRTPITAVYGGTRVLRSRGERLDEESKARLLEDIEQESERLFRMVENLLVLSRLELGQQVATEPVLAQRVIGKLASAFKQRRPGRPLEVKVDEQMPAVAAEPHYLEHVLRNLLTNADKYSASDTTIEIEARIEGDEAEIVILDRGPGIAPEETETIFERFYRSDRTSGQAAGIGLGLTVCKRLMEAQAGRVWARPREGGGLEAGITMPVYKEVLA
jgi:PAS domain S-box-containing protein